MNKKIEKLNEIAIDIENLILELDDVYPCDPGGYVSACHGYLKQALDAIEVFAIPRLESSDE